MQNVANAYKKADLGSAPKHQIVERLYARFANDIDVARDAIQTGDIKSRATAIDHAMQIVSELQAALDHAAAPELCANLAALYDFVTQKLVETNSLQKAEPLDQVTRVMNELAGAFRQAHVEK